MESPMGCRMVGNHLPGKISAGNNDAVLSKISPFFLNSHILFLVKKIVLNQGIKKQRI